MRQEAEAGCVACTRCALCGPPETSEAITKSDDQRRVGDLTFARWLIVKILPSRSDAVSNLTLPAHGAAPHPAAPHDHRRRQLDTQLSLPEIILAWHEFCSL
ncbi:hypothetical protein EVAR_44311_1 [Eumeta japonica]|uniref:Uncharacterized protein n=1 Tax=Eumeta variegata TaxID=151549 RepID=A0A4C1WR24_EUMVA|nr:hypothetical protein EVAR_44311_1 [Eumeta japonica]